MRVPLTDVGYWPDVTGVTSHLHELAARHPTVPLALRAAVAAVGAWMVVSPLGGIADDYPYYAPLGAVVTVSTTVATSIRTALQTFLALAGGAALGGAGLMLEWSPPVGIGVVVGLGSLAASSPWLGSMGIWVPISALFILILGRGDPGHFVLAYLGLTTLGAAVGAAMNAAFPPLHLATIRRAQEQLRSALVDQLDALADGLDTEPLPPAHDDWEARRLGMESQTRRVQELVSQATREPPVNWRARRWRDQAERLRAQGSALVNLSFLVGDLTVFLAEHEHAERQDVPLGPGLRPPTARALREVGEALRSVDGSIAGEEELKGAWDAARELAAEVRDLRRRIPDDLFAAGSLVVGIRRVLLSITPTEAEQEAAQDGEHEDEQRETWA